MRQQPCHQISTQHQRPEQPFPKLSTYKLASMMSSPSFPLYTPPPSTTNSFINAHEHSPASPLPFSYIPQTPSPLRTSRNANLMPPPPTPTAPTKSSPLASIENVWTTTSIDENTFNFFSPSTSTTSNPFAKESNFSRRARSQSPITELTSRATTARDRRKSLFLEQIRAKREDEKFEVRGEQVLRMDWARGEAERKARLARQAQRLTMQMQLEEEDMMLDWKEEGQDAGGPPSPTEEKELEELIRLHEESKGQEGKEEDMMDDQDLDDEDYDQLFREVIGVGASSQGQEEESQSQSQSCFTSQNQNQQQQQQHLQQGAGIFWPTPQQQDLRPAFGDNSDESMDMDIS